ncbi:MAG: hypothetical protein P8X74_08365 [Reinekea sp.]
MKVLEFKKVYFSIFFLLVVLFPLFPAKFNASQVHINILVLAGLVLPAIFIGRSNLVGLGLWVTMYFILCQIALLPALFFDFSKGGIGSVSFTSFFRPTMLFVSVVGCTVLLRNVDTGKLCDLIAYIVFGAAVYAVLEVFFLDLDRVSSIVFGLYKREYRTNLLEVSTTFFATTYYSAFVFFTFLVLLYSRFLQTLQVRYCIASLLAILLIFLSQSKAIIFCTIVSVWLLGLISQRKVFFYLSIFFLLTIPVLLINLRVILDMLSIFDLRIVKDVKLLLLSANESETLNIRLDQIANVIESALLNNGFGVGLIPELSLESWVAVFVFRYGIFGLVFFLGLVSVLSFYCLITIRAGNNQNVWLAKAGLVWSMLLPLSQLSSAMIEYGKTAFVANFMIALIIVTYFRSRHVEV